METVEQMRNVAQDLIASYDARVDAIGTIMDNTYQVLDDFKDKRAKLSAELKDTLAKRGSLRKKDFDRMMNGILLNQEEKEKEVKQSLKIFIKEQKKEAFELKDALIKGEVERMKKAQIEIENGIAEIKGLLKGFYEQQKELTEGLRKPLTKGNDLKIKDFKDMIRNLQTLTRGKEVKKMGNLNALGNDMADSYHERKKEVRDLFATCQKEDVARRAEVNQMMEGFQTENAQLKKDTHKLMDDIRGELRDLFAGFQKETVERQTEVAQMMEGFRTENAEIREQTHKLMDEIRGELKDLFVGFQKETVERQTEVTQMMKGFRKENAQRIKEVSKFMNNVRGELDELWEGCRKETKERRSEVKTLLQDFRKEADQLAADVKEMWTIVARAKGGAKTVSAHSFAQTEEKKPGRRGKKKPKKAEVIEEEEVLETE